MAGQTELIKLKKAMEKMSQKVDKTLTLVQGLVNFLTSVILNSDLGLNADNVLIEEPPQIYHPRVKLLDMSKDLVEFHDSKTHSKEDDKSLSETSAG
ncbi:hypothetical protein RHMOL_Rhmol11G0034900 [Rhododendron molle]|uniref:Uncharacterized protein n=1 Tax=Rhododendron molle TaxID=49168 RepID=A0ACC0LN67_RHOML|nr:hypothetical protein RHMOL_Rhmol11G0034900 [Rhododendron molle]